MSGLQKNVASQKYRVFAFDPTDGTPKTGDEANISATIAKDWAVAAATDDVAPTEVKDGYYLFNLTQAETNADVIDFYPESSTVNIQVIGVPGTVFTVAPNFAELGIESDGDLTKVNTLDGHTAQTADHTAGIADIPTVAEFNARTLVAASYFDPAADTVATVTDVTNGVTLAATATSAQLVDDVWDETLTGGNHNIATSAGRRLRSIQDFGIYDLARVWVDEIAGTSTGTLDGEDATVTNRADDLDNALTVAVSVGLDEVGIQAGNSITLTASLAGYKVHAQEATIALGGQSIAGSRFIGATISGTFTGNPVFVDCVINGTITGPGATLIDCRLLGAIIENNGTDGWLIHNGRGETAGSSASLTYDFNSTVNADCSLRNYSGGIQIEGMVATNEMSIEGFGSITEGTCTAGSPQIRGVFKINSITNLTPNTEAAINRTNINTEADTALTDYDPPTKTEMDTAFTEIKGATWASGTDTLEHIRDKQTDIEADTQATLVDTNELQTDWTNGGRLDLILDATLAMLDDARAEPGQGAPAVNPDAMTKIDYIYKAWRNKTLQSATEYKLYDNAGTTIDQKATVSDDGTDFTRGEVGTGA